MNALTDNELRITEYHLTFICRLLSKLEQWIFSHDDFRHYRTRWNGIYGWLTEKQAKWLFEMASTAQSGVIVEIGSCYGRSTVCLGLGASLVNSNNKVYSIDPHTGGKGFREKLEDKDSYSSLEGFKNNLKRFLLNEKVVPIIKTSADALSEWHGHKISLLFIDGWHTYDAVKHDILGWSKHVVSEGIVAMHDYQDKQVRRAIHDSIVLTGMSETALEHIGDGMVFFRLP